MHKQSGGGSHDHKEREEIGQKSADIGFHLRVDDLAGFDLLIIGKTADKELAPGGDGGSQHAHTDEQITAQIGWGEIYSVGVKNVADGHRPVRMGFDSRDDVGDVEQTGDQHDSLSEFVVPADHHQQKQHHNDQDKRINR